MRYHYDYSCDDCGFDTNNIHDVRGDDICDECFDEHYNACRNCGEIVHNCQTVNNQCVLCVTRLQDIPIGGSFILYSDGLTYVAFESEPQFFGWRLVRQLDDPDGDVFGRRDSDWVEALPSK